MKGTRLGADAEERFSELHFPVVGHPRGKAEFCCTLSLRANEKGHRRIITGYRYLRYWYFEFLIQYSVASNARFQTNFISWAIPVTRLTGTT